jgi:hypothetical protein
MEILEKCLIINPDLLAMTALCDLISPLREAIAMLPEAGDEAHLVRRLLNRHLSAFYNDMANLPKINLASKGVVIDLIGKHLEMFKMTSGRRGFKSLLIEFFSWSFSPGTLVLLCADRSNGCLFSRNLIPFLRQNLLDLGHTRKLLSMVLTILSLFLDCSRWC